MSDIYLDETASKVKELIEERGLHWWFYERDDNQVLAGIRARPDSRTIVSGYGCDYSGAVIETARLLPNVNWSFLNKTRLKINHV